jgi:hypothetical protein
MSIYHDMNLMPLLWTGDKPALAYLVYKFLVVSFFWASLSYTWANYRVSCMVTTGPPHVVCTTFIMYARASSSKWIDLFSEQPGWGYPVEVCDLYDPLGHLLPSRGHPAGVGHPRVALPPARLRTQVGFFIHCNLPLPPMKYVRVLKLVFEICQFPVVGK